MTKSPSDFLCSCCGGPLPEGRQYTCNARCEAAYNGLIDEYVQAAKLHRHGFERGPYDRTDPVNERDPWFLEACAIVRAWDRAHRREWP